MREVRRRGSIFNATFNTAFAIALTGFASAARADPIPQGFEASNMTPIGYSRAREPARRLQDDAEEGGERPLVHVSRPSLASRLDHRRRHRSEKSDLREAHSGAAQHLDHPGHVARQYPGDGVAAGGDRLGPRREGALRSGRADLGHQRSGQSEGDLALAGPGRKAPTAIPIRAAATLISPRRRKASTAASS